MIQTPHGYIRAAEREDAPALARLYDPEYPRAALLDAKREPIMPTEDEVRELLSRKEVQQGVLYAVEDTAGVVCGFCSVRGVNPEAGFGETSLLFLADATYETPLAEDALGFVLERAFERQRLRKLLANGLDGETALKQFLLGHGFESSGVQRNALYSLGQWHNLEVFTRFAG
ncbi:MAG TPA: GNAT family N-acetyltransferase [Candidatus Hydrogenedentes bacterium]|nr:GNAT family N-acetyltransferase [Candidatus Hydrogenedentota bacterium]